MPCVFHKQVWVIKALGITGTGAAIGLTLQQKQPFIALAACVIPLFFWTLESQWKHFQRGFYPRIAEIETILRDNYHQLPNRRLYAKGILNLEISELHYDANLGLGVVSLLTNKVVGVWKFRFPQVSM